ncbi:MAG: arginase family protein, partial [Candidatus Bathyarchaeia archaeon]
MKLRELFRPTPQGFLDVSRALEGSRYVILGAPMDLTGTYRRGSRFAPTAIRRASLYLESYSLRSDLDAGEAPFCDLGDLRGGDDVEEWVGRIEVVVREGSRSGRVPIMLGGEHTITLGAARAFEEAAIVDFDAHLDLRDEFLGRRFSHTTFLHRVVEEREDRRIIILGARALSEEEMDYALEKEIRYLTAGEMRARGVRGTLETALEFVPEEVPIYITIDMDVLDPSEAPAVCNPAPEGIGVTELLDILHGLC